MKRNTPAWHALRKGSSDMMPASHWSSARQERAEQQLRQLIRTLWSGMYVRWEYAVQCASNDDCLHALSERGLLGEKSDSPDENSLAEAYLDLLMMHTKDLVRGEARQLRAALRNERCVLLRMTRGLIEKTLCAGLGVGAQIGMAVEAPLLCAANALPQEVTIDVGPRLATALLMIEIEAGCLVAQQDVLSQREARRAGRAGVGEPYDSTSQRSAALRESQWPTSRPNYRHWG